MLKEPFFSLFQFIAMPNERLGELDLVDKSTTRNKKLIALWSDVKIDSQQQIKK